MPHYIAIASPSVGKHLSNSGCKPLAECIKWAQQFINDNVQVTSITIYEAHAVVKRQSSPIQIIPIAEHEQWLEDQKLPEKHEF